MCSVLRACKLNAVEEAQHTHTHKIQVDFIYKTTTIIIVIIIDVVARVTSQNLAISNIRNRKKGKCLKIIPAGNI